MKLIDFVKLVSLYNAQRHNPFVCLPHAKLPTRLVWLAIIDIAGPLDMLMDLDPCIGDKCPEIRLKTQAAPFAYLE